LAVRAGRPREALEHYARSIEEADTRGNQLQVLFDLIGGAVALVGIGSDVEAVELAAIADQLVSEMGGPKPSGSICPEPTRSRRPPSGWGRT
jgi:hypothetical protein